MKTSNEHTDEISKAAAEWAEHGKSLRQRGYTTGEEWDNDGDDLNKGNCSPEPWKALGGDEVELTDEEDENFLDGKLFDTLAKGK